MFLKLKDNELNIKTSKKIKTMSAKSSLTLGSFAVFSLFIVFKAL